MPSNRRNWMYKNWKGGGKITWSHADLNWKTQENQLGKFLQIIKFSEISRHTVMYKNVQQYV